MPTASLTRRLHTELPATPPPEAPPRGPAPSSEPPLPDEPPPVIQDPDPAEHPTVEDPPANPTRPIH